MGDFRVGKGVNVHRVLMVRGNSGGGYIGAAYGEFAEVGWVYGNCRGRESRFFLSDNLAAVEDRDAFYGSHISGIIQSRDALSFPLRKLHIATVRTTVKILTL